MSQYRRVTLPGGCFFFTLVTAQRYPWFSENRNIQRLREAFEHVRNRYPFRLDAIVVLPDHLHCVMGLPENDLDYAKRIRLIKHYVSVGIETTVNERGEKRVWQKRYWEHLLRDDADWRRHVDYTHFNPVKHGYVDSPAHWRHSSFRRAVEQGLYEADWGYQLPADIAHMDCE